jgi:hypothetical protein
MDHDRDRTKSFSVGRRNGCVFFVALTDETVGGTPPTMRASVAEVENYAKKFF